MSVASASRPTR